MQEIGHLGAAAAGLVDQRPGQRDQGFGEQVMVARPLGELGRKAQLLQPAVHRTGRERSLGGVEVGPHRRRTGRQPGIGRGRRIC